MKMAVFGATGGTGRQVVQRALHHGHQVTAVVRDPARLPIAEQPGLDVVTADMADSDAIVSAVTGQDAVISAIGTRKKGPTSVCTNSARGIVDAMRESGVRRLLVLSNSGNYAEGDAVLLRTLVKPILRRMLRYAYRDMDTMEHDVRRSGLDWTIVRPPQLTDKAPTGSVQTRSDGNVRGSYRIPRADLADFLVRAADDATMVAETVSVAG